MLELMTIWNSSWQFSADETAELLRTAVRIIEQEGYDGETATGSYEGSHGICINEALLRVAGGDYDVQSELLVRVTATLYLTGQATGRHDFADRLVMWQESDYIGGTWRHKTQAEAIALLTTTARMIETLTTS